MAEQDARGALAVARAEGLLEGQLEVTRSLLLRLLSRVNLVPTGEELARIEACTDTTTLDRWLCNVRTAKTITEVLI